MNNFPTKERFHPKGATAQEYKELCNQAGNVQKGQSVNGWKVIDHSGDKSGFKGTAYEKNGKIVICYEGTNIKSAKDHKSNLEMGLGGPSEQMKSATKNLEEEIEIPTGKPKANLDFSSELFLDYFISSEFLCPNPIRFVSSLDKKF